MSFASTLKEYCALLDCTDKAIAEACGVSPSAFSRYLHGERTPEAHGEVIASMAYGISRLSAESGIGTPLQAAEVQAALEAELMASEMIGLDFNARFDALMRLIGIRNAIAAEVTGVDPSYISRIRRGQRSPADMPTFARTSSHLAAHICIERDLFKQVGNLVDSPTIRNKSFLDGANPESETAEIIEVWLKGSQIVVSDTVEMNRLFEWLDNTDLSEWVSLGSDAPELEPQAQTPVARFYYGLGGMRAAESQFLDTALDARARNFVLSSDVPLPQLAVDYASVDAYMHVVKNIVRSGAHIDIIHSLERPLGDAIRSMKLWIPLYLTGRVTPSYLVGVNNRFFCHVNRVCDACALSAEAVMGHQEDGRYYFTTRPEDVSYYKRKMSLVLGKTISLCEIYRECDPGQKELFDKAEAARQAKGTGKRIGADKYKRIRIVSYPGDCIVISIPCGEQSVHLVNRHPKMNYIVARMD